MSYAHLRHSIEGFLRRPESEILAIKGPWGAGKTFAWRALEAEFRSKGGGRGWSYASTFGLSSVGELRLQLLLKSFESERADDLGRFEKLKQKVIKAFSKVPLPLLGKLRLRDLSLSELVDSPIADRFLFGKVICIDDLERTDWKKIAPFQLFGFISALRDELNCKVVLIYNNDGLEGAIEEFTKLREKLLDSEIAFSMSSDEIVDLAFASDFLYRPILNEVFRALNISNIRISKRVRRVYDELKPLLESSSRATVERVLRFAAFAAVVILEPTKDRPTKEYLIDWSFDSRAMVRILGKDQSSSAEAKARFDTEESWDLLMRKAGIAAVLELEREVFKVVEVGHLSEKIAIEAALSESSRADNFLELKTPLSRAWSKIYGSLRTDLEKAFDEMSAAVRTAFPAMSVNDLNNVVWFFRYFGKNAEADRVIDEFIVARMAEPEIFDLYNSGGAIVGVADKILIEKFETYLAKDIVLPGLETVLNGIADSRSGRTRAELALKRSTADQISEALLDISGDKLNGVIDALLSYQHSERTRDIGERSYEALKKLSANSEFHKFRLRKWVKENEN